MAAQNAAFHLSGLEACAITNPIRCPLCWKQVLKNAHVCLKMFSTYNNLFVVLTPRPYIIDVNMWAQGWPSARVILSTWVRTSKLFYGGLYKRSAKLQHPVLSSTASPVWRWCDLGFFVPAFFKGCRTAAASLRATARPLSCIFSWASYFICWMRQTAVWPHSSPSC